MVLHDIILLVLKDAHVMYSGVADKIQPYRIEIVVAGANLKTAYSYILENFHFYISKYGKEVGNKRGTVKEEVK